ncbi:hypothetical protein CEXT_152991 [Caerostris extrusa]|uniref:C2H2-type domain-containing protein n=1 Tax=Caerostris extrusa TaxID=172846 RepID=A0AAV4UNS7_CAEEX|nr:hypothetical protein CEXT_152991 [Caerostris extrusa]
MLIFQILKFIIAGILETNNVKVPQPFLGPVLVTWFKDIDSRSALPLTYDAGRPATGRINSSAEQSVFPNIHQRSDCEATETAEIQSSNGIENQSQYNPEISDFMFLYMPQDQENQSESTPSPIADQHNPMPVAEPRLLPGFQQAFGQRNALAIQMAQRINISSQIECSGTSSTDVMSSSFTSDFNENFNASANLMSQHYETSKGIPTSVDLNAQYNPMDPIPPTDSTGPIHSSKCPKDFQPKYHLKPGDLSCSVRRPYAYWKNTSAASTLGKNYINVSNVVKALTDSDTLRAHIRTVHTDDKPHKCTECGRCFAFLSQLKRHMLIHNKA